jgi:hypothetical protein
LEALAILPWSERAIILNPQRLETLSQCMLTYINFYRGKLMGNWSQGENPEQKCKSSDPDGYVVTFRIRKGKITRVDIE